MIGPSVTRVSLIDANLDNATTGIKTILTDHNLIHKGQAFTVSNKVDIAASKVAGLSFLTPADKYVHFKPSGIASSGGPITVSLLEDYTFTGGSDFPPVNRRRVGTPTAAETVVKVAADITAAAGTNPVSMEMLLIPSSTQGQTKLEAAGGSTEEWVLKPGTSYLLAISNPTASTVTVGYSLFWYEEDGY